MESFNFGAFDTNLGARIAAIPQEAQKQQTANMLQAMQMQGVMNQNELAQSQMRTARRAEEGQTLLGKAYGGLDFSGAGDGGVPGQSPFAAMKSQLIKSLTASNRPDLIPSELAKLTEMEHKANVNEELKGKLAKQAREAVDSELTSFTKNAPKVTDVPSLTNHLKAFYENPLLGKIATRFKSFEQALNDDIKQISTPEGLRQWQAENANLTGKELTDLLLKVTTTITNLGDVSRETQRSGLGRIIGVPVDTRIGVSPNTIEQINATRRNHLETLAQQGWTFDTERGIAVNPRLGISQSISTLMAPVEPQGFAGGVAPAAPAAPAAPVAIPTAPSAAPAGNPPLQLNVTPGIAPSSASTMQIPQAIAGARVPQALQNVRDNDRLSILLKERENQVFLGRVDPALDREIANLQGKPTNVASQTTTQPAQRTVLGPKPEKATESYYAEAKGILNTNDAINNLKRVISSFTPTDMVNPARRAEIDQAHKTAVLLSKEMFKLGVLNGGDQKILEQVIPDPIAFSKGLVSIETIRKNMNSASNIVNNMNKNLSRVHKQPLLILEAETPSAPNPSAPPIQSFRR